MAAPLPFRDINVHASASHYAFSSPSSPSTPTLVIDRPSGDLRLQDDKMLGSKRVSSIAGILGMIKLRLDKYLILISKAKPVGKLKGHTIYKVVATEVLPLRERQLKDPDEETFVNMIKAVIKAGPMYFSYSLDITSSFQRQSQTDITVPMWKRADDRFFWNKFLQTDFMDFRAGGTTRYGFRQVSGEQPAIDPYILPVMYGMLEIKNASVKGHPFKFAVITRRSRFRAGTRYFSRGIDEQGHVSNFNETEQLILLNDDDSRGLGGYEGSGGYQNGKIGGSAGQEVQVLSYVQTRGSVPVYWTEVNNLHYTPKLQVRAVESAVHAAKLHFDEQIRTYGDNYLVNLVNQKGREKRIKDAYEQLIKILVSTPSEGKEADRKTSEKFDVIEADEVHQKFDRLHYVYFDFHSETKGLRWHRAKLLMEQLEQPVLSGGYFRSIDMPGDSYGRVEVRNTQRAVVRTNCMDCLDRTNVVQSMLGRYIITRMLIDLGYLREGELCEDDAAFENLFRNMWADNADVVSKSYSGTGALKTDFTRTGNRTKMGMFNDFNNSTTRYVCNNFLDGPRQDAFDLFLGAYLPESAAGNIFVDNRPLLIQAIPYIVAGGVFFILVGSFTRRDLEANVWPLRLMMIVSFLVAGGCLRFMWTHGTLFVKWPKLNPPAHLGLQDVLSHAEEGKKRKE
ncbi:hypothetical protein NA57DRAFT_53012 [Rhizodiscina lignyota]|uniref:SAC domain-containing protein n=1 Tax=Rhizodiscina lignyota TaxID=1504668 RepID=A0A9P4MFF4_9PEZI|nr:hypothetical protein NA57DRAFT_53012 [Rhizodiscina lignyota]